MSFELVFTDATFRQQRERRVMRLVALCTTVMLVLSLVWLALGIWWQAWPVVWVEVAGLLASLVLAVVLRRGRPELARRVCAILILALLVGVMYVEGVGPRTPPVAHLYFVCLGVSVYLLFFDAPPAVARAFVTLCAALFVAREFGWLLFDAVLPIEPQNVAVARHLTVVAFFVILLALTRMFVVDIDSAERHLAHANERLEEMLENMLPQSVARRLREEGHSFADAFPSCSILIADIVSFTRFSASRPPEQVVAMLDEVFSAFDRLVERAGVEKIKTIGDAYMVVSGLPEPRSDHAAALARLALDMQKSIRPFGLQLRIGIHTGAVVAGLIGRKRFLYDLWGDTVNVAWRMQSTCVRGGIQLSERTRRELPQEFQVTARRRADAGRGPATTYLLTGVVAGIVAAEGVLPGTITPG